MNGTDTTLTDEQPTAGGSATGTRLQSIDAGSAELDTARVPGVEASGEAVELLGMGPQAVADDVLPLALVAAERVVARGERRLDASSRPAVPDLAQGLRADTAEHLVLVDAAHVHLAVRREAHGAGSGETGGRAAAVARSGRRRPVPPW